ncbi:hypothetical protein GF322_01260 [Candidatus Dependentiae bacterium]|nr:hypothetical protein [Candidatus Dependentiae bacterium]
MFIKSFKFKFVLCFLFCFFNKTLLFSINYNEFNLNIFFERVKETLLEVCKIQNSYVKNFSNDTVQFEKVFDLSSVQFKNDDFSEFDLSENNLNDIKSEQNVEIDDDQKDFCKTNFYKQIKFLLNKITSFKFTVKNIKSYKLAVFLKEIDELENEFVNFLDKSFLVPESVYKIKTIFDLLRKGIALELSFDHLVLFRENLILYVQKILNLIDCWMMELHHNSFFDLVKNSFQHFDEEELKVTIKKLNLLKDRVSSFLGKTDELFMVFFKANNNLIQQASLKDFGEIERDLNYFVNQSIFCINSFFSNTFNPDVNYYSQQLKKLTDDKFVEFIKLLCQNHVNVQFMQSNFKHQIKEFKIPSFLSRHWLILSALGLATSVGGGYLYYNWDWLTSDEETSPKKRIVKIFSKTENWIIQSFKDLQKMIKDNFWPDMDKGGGDDPESLKNQMKEPLENLKRNRTAFQKKLKDKYDELCENNIIDIQNDGAYEDLENLLNAVEGFKNKVLKTRHERVSTLAQNIKNAGIELQTKLKDFHENFNLGNCPSGWFKATAIQNDVFHLLQQLQSYLKTISDRNLGSETVHYLCNLLDNVCNLINDLTSQIKNGGNLGQLWEVVVFKLISDILNLTHFGVDKTIEKLDESYKIGKVTLNWIQALIPVLLTTIVVPLINIVIIKNIMDKRKTARYNKVNNIISEIYRILILYKSPSVDFYDKDLKYKDKGMIGFWIDVLTQKIDTVSRVDKSVLSRLVAEVQNPDYSVGQKMEFIKLEWGKYLFANGAIV